MAGKKTLEQKASSSTSAGPDHKRQLQERGTTSSHVTGHNAQVVENDFLILVSENNTRRQVKIVNRLRFMLQVRMFKLEINYQHIFQVRGRVMGKQRQSLDCQTGFCQDLTVRYRNIDHFGTVLTVLLITTLTFLL